MYGSKHPQYSVFHKYAKMLFMVTIHFTDIGDLCLDF